VHACAVRAGDVWYAHRREAGLRTIIGIAIALLATWLLLVVALLAARPRGAFPNEAMRLLPDTLRMLKDLASDRDVTVGVRIRVWLLFAYLAMPFDLIPDFIPVLGYADDVIVAVLVLRSIIRRAGPDAIRRHWPGTQDGLGALGRAAKLTLDPTT
jgi:uncharacterized membrane protein YkvA (DUF1232 family)